MSRFSTIPPVADPIDSFTARVAEYAATLAEIGTPEAAASIEAIAKALAGMAEAFTAAAAVIQSELPTAH